MVNQSVLDEAISLYGVELVAKKLARWGGGYKYAWGAVARPSQLPPPGDWLTWLIMTGRGWGKTRTGAETCRMWVAEGCRRLALVGRTPADVRDTMVEGESGILAVSPPDDRPIYEPTKRKITWPNGAEALTFTSYEPDQLRGPQFERIWWDELQAFQYARETWNNGQLALRLGRPRQIITMTPRPIGLIKEIIASPDTAITRGTTYENRQNLAPEFFRQVIARYVGTSLARQEIHGELLDELPGALWQRGVIRQKDAVNIQRIVVGVDPATTSQEDSDETGIIVFGVDNHAPSYGYVMGDYSLRAKPDEWARKVVQMYHQHHANYVVAESNQGGEMVSQVIHTVDQNVPVKLVHATTGKHTRAEPVSALYEQGRVFHVRAFTELEAQM